MEFTEMDIEGLEPHWFCSEHIIKIGTKEEEFWTDISEKTKKEIETLEKLLKFNKAILEMADERRLKENDTGNRKTD